MGTILRTGLAALLIAAPLAMAEPPARQQDAPAAKTATDSTPGSAYYYFTLGHLQELQYEATNKSQFAEDSIQSYKKALEMDPGSAVIQERLAEIHAKSGHMREATEEAQAALKIEPDNVDAHRLLARIYVRALGEMSGDEVPQANITQAIEQFEAILKIEPDDTYSALWLARLYRFENHHSDAEKILRQVLQKDPDNSAALEQLSQLLVDEGRSQEAIDLLTQASKDSPSPDIYDLLGSAYAQAKNSAKAEAAYRKAVAHEPDDAGHRHGLA